MHSRNTLRGCPVGIDRLTADEADPQNVMENFVMEYRITDNASREAVFGNAEQYISDVKESWMYMGTFSGMDEFKNAETRKVKRVPVENAFSLGVK